MMNWMSGFVVAAVSAVFLLPARASAQVEHVPLESVDALVLHNVAAEPATLQGKSGAIGQPSTSRIRRGRGSDCARRPRRSMKPTSISRRDNGRKSRSMYVAPWHDSTSTITNSRR